MGLHLSQTGGQFR